MYVILVALGLVGTVAGVGLIVLNPPVDAIRLAYTLLILGAIAFTGGAILIGVAAANRQLRRIAQLLDTRTPRAAGVPGSSDIPSGLPPLVQAPTSLLTEAAGSPPAPDFRAQPDAAFHSVVLDPAVVDASAPHPAAPKPENASFDAMWASASRAAHGNQGTHDPARNEPYADGTAPPPADGETVAVFRSGVIDGMAYTLYTDGSIEAEMPGGTVRFATVDDLRAYLDENA